MKRANKASTKSQRKIVKNIIPAHHKVLVSVIIVVSSITIGFLGGLLLSNARYDFSPPEEIALEEGSISDHFVYVYGDGGSTALDLLKDKYDVDVSTANGKSVVTRIGNISVVVDSVELYSWNFSVNGEVITEDPSSFVPTNGAEVEWRLASNIGE